ESPAHLFPHDLLGPERQVRIIAVGATNEGVPEFVNIRWIRLGGRRDELKPHLVAGPHVDAVTVQPLGKLPVHHELLGSPAHATPPFWRAEFFSLTGPIGSPQTSDASTSSMPGSHSDQRCYVSRRGGGTSRRRRGRGDGYVPGGGGPGHDQ